MSRAKGPGQAGRLVWRRIDFAVLILLVFISGGNASNNLSGLVPVNPEYECAWWKAIVSRVKTLVRDTKTNGSAVNDQVHRAAASGLRIQKSRERRLRVERLVMRYFGIRKPDGAIWWIAESEHGARNMECGRG